MPVNSSITSVNLSIYDLLGREVAVLVNDKPQSGSYEVVWNASALPSGVYICKIQAGLYTQAVKKVMLN